MKKFTALFIVLMMLVALVSCGGGDNKTDEGGIQVNSGLLNVELLLPASFFEDETPEEIMADAAEKGIDECTVNEDGSVKYVMSKSKHKELLDTLKAGFDELTYSMLNGDDKIESIVSIDSNDDLSEIKIVTTSEEINMWEGFAMLSLYMSGSYYQAFSGVNSEDIDVAVSFINSTTNEVIHTSTYKEYIKNLSESASAEEETEPVVSTTDALSVTEKQTVSIADVCEFYVDYTAITARVNPPSPSSYYSYYDAEAGKTYVDICFAYKNLAPTEINADSVVSATLIYGEKYQYQGFSIIEEDSRGDFTYSNITSIDPLSLEYVHYLFLLPSEAEASSAKIDIQFTIGGNKYIYNVRDGATGDVAALSADASPKTSGTLVNGEKVALINNCEFYIEYSAVKDRIDPPVPADYYSYYEAEDGKVYVDVCVAYKNWKASAVGADNVISGKLKYADKYEYSGFTIIEEDSRGDFTYSNITSVSPLSWEYIHYLFEVPEEVASSTEAVVLTLTVGGNTYTYNVR